MPAARDRLRDPEPRARLLAALVDIDRLVLLGDVVELRHGPVREALSAAVPVLRAIAGALREAAEVVVVPGNHDHHLLDGWLARREPTPLGLENDVHWCAGEPLAALADALAPARVRVAYPGVWLRPDVFATHGHFGDRHTTVPMLERLAAGAMARVAGEPDGGPAAVEDYERVLAPTYAWIHALAQAGGPAARRSHGASAGAWSVLAARRDSSWRARWRRRALGAGFATAIAGLNRAGLGPLESGLAGADLRRGGLRAQAEVVRRLGIDAHHVLFGHTHRAGPLGRNHLAEWTAGSGVRLWNSGCWVHEPAFLGPDPARSPYRPGFAVELDDAGPPRLVNLLEGDSAH